MRSQRINYICCVYCVCPFLFSSFWFSHSVWALFMFNVYCTLRLYTVGLSNVKQFVQKRRKKKIIAKDRSPRERL